MGIDCGDVLSEVVINREGRRTDVEELMLVAELCIAVVARRTVTVLLTCGKRQTESGWLVQPGDRGGEDVSVAPPL